MIHIKRSPDARDAVEAARASHRQAVRDLDAQRKGLDATHKAVDRLRAHNATNHYTEWLERLIIGRRA